MNTDQTIPKPSITNDSSSLNDPLQLPEIPTTQPINSSVTTTTNNLPVLEGLPKQSFPPQQISVTPGKITAPPTHHHWWLFYEHLFINHPIKYFLALALTIESLYGFYESIEYLVKEYPSIELKLSTHEITYSELTFLVARILAIFASSALSTVFALRLSFNKSQVAEELHLLFSIILFFANIYLFTSLTPFSLVLAMQKLGELIANLLSF